MSSPSAARLTLIRHLDAQAWGEAIADELALLLANDLKAHGQARLLLSGGSTPAPVYELLAGRELDWQRIEVGLVDERWLSPQDPDSNAWLVRHSLLDHAEDAGFVPLVRAGKSIEECVHSANLHARHAQPASVAVLGMGGDGHTASLFPGSTDLLKALHNPLPYAALDATGCPGANQWPLRITLTPAGLAAASNRVLLLRGKQKLQMLDAALAGDDPQQYPIRAAIDLPGPPLRVHWCA